MKVTDKNFRDWEGEAFGYGYGTGENYIIPKLKQFLESIPYNGAYDYNNLEMIVGCESAWFLINILCKEDIIEYGTSPHYGWLNEKGKLLKEYISNKTLDEIYEILCTDDEDYFPCYRDGCNCNGYEPHKKCVNPLLF